VRELARAPGARESRWMHLLSGEPAQGAAASASAVAPAARVADHAFEARIGKLEDEVRELRAAVEALRAASRAD
jgi:uncharacterized protein YceH (UPF0502 family)